MLLAIGRDYMRLAVLGQEDAVEYRLVDGYLAVEDGERIELESVITNGESDSDAIAAERPPEIASDHNEYWSRVDYLGLASLLSKGREVRGSCRTTASRMRTSSEDQ